jgi:GNAT superfamily N-acetyltransferase
MPDYIIRKAVSGDLDGLHLVFSQADRMHREAHPEIFQEADDPNDTKDFLLESLRSQNAVVLVADMDGEIIAALMAWVRQASEIAILVPRTYLSVDNLVVDEGYRQQGIGQALMHSIHNWAQANGIKEVQLTVWDFNHNAMNFYRDLGYEMLHHRMRRELK